MINQPQIGEVWGNSIKTVVFTIFDMKKDSDGWRAIIQLNGESAIRTAYYDPEFKRLHGFTRLA